MSSLPTYRLTVSNVPLDTSTLIGYTWSLREDSTTIVTSDDSTDLVQVTPTAATYVIQNKEYIVTEGSGNSHYGIDFHNAIHNKPELTLQTQRPNFEDTSDWNWLGITWKLERKEAGASDDTYETLHLSNGPTSDSQFLIETFSTEWTAPPAETHTYTVTVAPKTENNPRYGQGSEYAYYLNGFEAPTIHFKVGDTYVFDQTDASNDIHPIIFRTDENLNSGGMYPFEFVGQDVWTNEGIWTNITDSGHTEWVEGGSRTLTVTPRGTGTFYYAAKLAGIGGYAVYNYMGGAMLDIASNPSPTELPVITLSTESVSVAVNTVYSDVGVSATDSNNNDISSQIVVSGTVDTSILGNHTLTYDVTDFYGNAAVQVTRTVSVVDETRPVIELNGDAVMTINVGDTYDEPGATATDNVDTILPENISIIGTVDVNTPGDYIITYSVSDSSGNAAYQVTRTVTVVASDPPAEGDGGGADVVDDPVEGEAAGGDGSGEAAGGGDGSDPPAAVSITIDGMGDLKYNLLAGDAATHVVKFNGEIAELEGVTLKKDGTETTNSLSLSGDSLSYSWTGEAGLITVDLALAAANSDLSLYQVFTTDGTLVAGEATVDNPTEGENDGGEGAASADPYITPMIM